MFHGSMVALITPMGSDGSVDVPALERLVAFHLHNGTDAIVAMGTTGESATLNFEEHCDVVARVVDFVAGKIPVIAGTGSNATREAIELTRCAQKAGADACLLVTPYYNKPSQEGLFLHYQAIAEAVAIPQILYNVPGRTACDMLPETVERLSVIPNIVGLKEASGRVERVIEIKQRCGDSLDVYSGDDGDACEAILSGAQGVISVTANVAPQAMHELCVQALAGNRQQAEAIDHRLQGLHRTLFLESNPIPVKWAVEQLGLIGGGIRLPLTPLATQHHDSVRAAISDAGIELS